MLQCPSLPCQPFAGFGPGRSSRPAPWPSQRSSGCHPSPVTSLLLHSKSSQESCLSKRLEKVPHVQSARALLWAAFTGGGLLASPLQSWTRRAPLQQHPLLAPTGAVLRATPDGSCLGLWKD